MRLSLRKPGNTARRDLDDAERSPVPLRVDAAPSAMNLVPTQPLHEQQPVLMAGLEELDTVLQRPYVISTVQARVQDHLPTLKTENTQVEASLHALQQELETARGELARMQVALVARDRQVGQLENALESSQTECERMKLDLETDQRELVGVRAENDSILATMVGQKLHVQLLKQANEIAWIESGQMRQILEFEQRSCVEYALECRLLTSELRETEAFAISHAIRAASHARHAALLAQLTSTSDRGVQCDLEESVLLPSRMLCVSPRRHSARATSSAGLTRESSEPAPLPQRASAPRPSVQEPAEFVRRIAMIHRTLSGRITELTHLQENGTPHGTPSTTEKSRRITSHANNE